MKQKTNQVNRENKHRGCPRALSFTSIGLSIYSRENIMEEKKFVEAIIALAERLVIEFGMDIFLAIDLAEFKIRSMFNLTGGE